MRTYSGLVEWLSKVYGTLATLNKRLPLYRWSYDVFNDPEYTFPLNDILRLQSCVTRDDYNTKVSSDIMPILFVFPRMHRSDLSLDPDCAKAQIILSMCEYPHYVIETTNSELSPTARLPVLSKPDGKFLSIIEIENEFLYNKYSSSNDAMAYTELLDFGLRPAILLEQVNARDNVFRHISNAYKTHSRHFFSRASAKLYKIDMYNYLNSKMMYPRRTQDSIFRVALKTASILASKLQQTTQSSYSDNEYIIGNDVSSADIIALAYLHIISTLLTVHESPLSTIFASHPILYKYLDRMHGIYRKHAHEYAFCAEIPTSLKNHRKHTLSHTTAAHRHLLASSRDADINLPPELRDLPPELRDLPPELGDLPPAELRL